MLSNQNGFGLVGVEYGSFGWVDFNLHGSLPCVEYHVQP